MATLIKKNLKKKKKKQNIFERTMLICTVLCFDKGKDNKAVTNINKQKRNKKKTAVKKNIKKSSD